MMSLQIGHPAIIAKHSGITTVADFRVDDIALGGQGRTSCARVSPSFISTATASFMPYQHWRHCQYHHATK
jgi:1,6-anhydro-N-acetylmuramate kinase